jgi:hypothetical protein
LVVARGSANWEAVRLAEPRPELQVKLSITVTCNGT